MLIKSALACIALIGATHAILIETIPGHISATVCLQDTVPSLSQLHEKDIDSIFSDFKTKMVVITLKTGKVLSYNVDKLNNEEENKLDRKIYEAVSAVTRTFTKAEHQPVFPGGNEAWNAYVKKFSDDNKDLLQSLGHGTVRVQFITDIYGNLHDVEPVSNTNSKLVDLAVLAVKKSGPWMPAIQNSLKVTCYQKADVQF